MDENDEKKWLGILGVMLLAGCSLFPAQAEMAAALKEVAADVKKQGYRLKIYDADRPQMDVDNFVAWAEKLDDTRMKPYFIRRWIRRGCSLMVTSMPSPGIAAARRSL